MTWNENHINFQSCSFASEIVICWKYWGNGFRIIEEAVWQDVKFYISNPEVAIKQLESVIEQDDHDYGNELEDLEQEITNLDTDRKRLIKVASKSSQIDYQTLGELLQENNEQKKSLEEYRDKIAERASVIQQLEEEKDLIGEYLQSLQEHIKNASIEEKRVAILNLVKSITVNSTMIDGAETPVVTITYRFNHVGSVKSLKKDNSVIKNRTGAPAGITALPRGPALARTR